MIGELLVAIPALVKLNEGQPLKNRDKYPAFNTEETDPAKFWDSLNKGKFIIMYGKRYYDFKHQVGTLALSQGYMTPNTSWNGSNTKYKDLKPKQQRIIKTVLKCKNEPYSALAIRGLCGNLFRVN